MALRNLRLLHISRHLPRLLQGAYYHECQITREISHLSQIPLILGGDKMGATISLKQFNFSRFSTVAEISKEGHHELDFMSFLKSTFDQQEGPYHYWLNKVEASNDFLEKDATILLVAAEFLENSAVSGSIPHVAFEKAKILQQRNPWLRVFGLLPSSLPCLPDEKNNLFQLVTKEYITFPVLLSNKDFSEVANGACFILFKAFKDPSYMEGGTKLNILQKAIKDLKDQNAENRETFDRLKASWWKEKEVTKEPYLSSSLGNLLLYFPACISFDETSNWFFLSDCNHHRIVIFDGNGKILDLIGSSPGFEDGNFETAKLMRPAASYYDASENSLYFVDSENHAVRKADLERRVVETLYPSSGYKEKGGLFTWIRKKLGLKENILADIDVCEPDLKSDEATSRALLFPWHLIKVADHDVLVMNRRLDTLWIMDTDKGLVVDKIQGPQKILEICGPQIMEKVSILKALPQGLLQPLISSTHTLNGIPYSSLLSSFVSVGNQFIICDTVDHRVLKVNGDSEVPSSFQLTSFGVLGLPYWLTCSLEKVFSNDLHGGAEVDHLQSFRLLPGRVDIDLSIEIPRFAQLVEPLQEGCVWRQARGAALEISGVQSIGASLEKVGAAQQFYDELDSIAFTAESEANSEKEEPTTDTNVDDDKVHIDCAVNTSPGSSEVTIFAALYLKLRSHHSGKGQEEKAVMISNILKPERNGRANRDTFIQLLSKSEKDLIELVFMKPLHVKIQFETPDYKKGKHEKEIELTNSTIEVNVPLC